MLNCREYTKCMLLNAAVLRHMLLSKNPVSSVMKKELGVVNESAGEISFSILARMIVKDTQKRKFEHLSEMYSMIPLFRETALEFDDDMMLSNGKNGHKYITRESQQVRSHVVFMKSWLRSVLRKGQCKFPSDITRPSKVKKGFLNLANGSLCWYGSARVYVEDSKTQLDVVRVHVESRLGTYYMEDMAHVWPSVGQRAVVGHEEADAEVVGVRAEE